MSGILWILAGGMSGWLTGKLIEEKGYGKPLFGAYTTSLDVFFGVIGAFIAGYLFFWAVASESSSLGYYATAILGFITLVGACRLISGRYFPSPSDRGNVSPSFYSVQQQATRRMQRRNEKGRKAAIRLAFLDYLVLGLP